MNPTPSAKDPSDEGSENPSEVPRPSFGIGRPSRAGDIVRYELSHLEQRVQDLDREVAELKARVETLVQRSGMPGAGS